MHRWCLHGPINFYHSFRWSNLILCPFNIDILNICMKEFGSEKIFFDKMTAVRTTIFHLNGFCICMDSAFMGRSTPTTVLMEQFDMLPLQYRHIEHMHEGV